MPTATLRIAALPEQARTARLVAGAAARRAGVDTDSLDDVRLAVAEAVARAVLRARAAEHTGEVDVAMTDDGSRFEIAVTDRVPAHLVDDEEELALSMMQALAAESAVAFNDEGGQTVTLTWPTVHAE